MSDMSAFLKLIEINPKLLAEIGDCPNVELPTMGGKVFWKNIRNVNGWRLQYNPVIRHARIIDENDIRKAWGNLNIMEEKFKRLTREEFLEPGDIIGIARKKALNMYEHYGVYVGEGKVVHYSGDAGDFGGRPIVKIDSLENFLKSDKNYFILHFEKAGLSPRKIQKCTSFNMSDVGNSYLKLMVNRKLKIYTPEETVKRALSRIGESEYNLIFNNCEHFAVWCKTGISESFQVKKIILGMLG